jgi:hypothetical protein
VPGPNATPQLEKLAEPGGPERQLGAHAFHFHIHPTIHVAERSLNRWQYGLAAFLGLLAAVTLIGGSVWLLEIGRRRRDARIAACFLGIRRALARGDDVTLGQFATEQFAASLVQDTSGDSPPPGRLSVNWVTVLKGGRRRDRECLARIEAIGGFLDVGATETKPTKAEWTNDVVWRFVRGSDRRWVAAGIDTEFFFKPGNLLPNGSPQTDVRPEAALSQRQGRALRAGRLAKRNQPAAGTAVVLMRPDMLGDEMESSIATRAAGLAPLVWLAEPLRRPVEGATANLPSRMILRLDGDGALRLLSLAMGKPHPKTSREVARWPAGSARVSLCPGHGLFRPVEIAYDDGRLLLAAPRRTKRQRAGLRIIREATAEATHVTRQEPGEAEPVS